MSSARHHSTWRDDVQRDAPGRSVTLLKQLKALTGSFRDNSAAAQARCNHSMQTRGNTSKHDRSSLARRAASRHVPSPSRRAWPRHLPEKIRMCETNRKHWWCADKTRDFILNFYLTMSTTLYTSSYLVIPCFPVLCHGCSCP